MHAVRNETQSLYQVLDVPRDATTVEIERAYRRIKGRLQQETTPPDQRLRVMIEHAHDVLTDPARRDAYDREWHSPAAQMRRARRSPVAIGAIVAAVACVSAAAWMALREEAPAEQTRPRKEVQSSVSMAVGRVSRIDMNGQDAPLGIAFAIAEGTLVTSCEGLSPKAQAVVHFGKRAAPVNVGASDEATGLCTLTGSNVGSWPLGVSSAAPVQGTSAYAIAMARDNEPKLVDSRIRKSAPGAVRVVEAEPAPPTDALGAPLLDRNGRVLGAAARIEGKVAYLSVPPSFFPKALPAPRPAEPEPKPDAPPAAEPAPPPPVPGVKISPERRERLEKAFHPPPNVPSDL
jgi:hypothetical protein